MKPQVTVKSFEETVWKVEGVRIVVRAKASHKVDCYKWKNSAPRTWRVSEWDKNRIRKCLNGESYEVIRGDGKKAVKHTSLYNLKKSYKE